MSVGLVGWVVLGVAALVLGFVGGRVATVGRRGPEELDVAAPGLGLRHLGDTIWRLDNVGPGTACGVAVVAVGEWLAHWPPPAADVELVMADVLPTLACGEATSFWLSRYRPGQQVLISWTSTAGVRMGPTAFVLPVIVEPARDSSPIPRAGLGPEAPRDELREALPPRAS